MGIGRLGAAIQARDADAGTTKGIGVRVSEWLGNHLWRRCALQRDESEGEKMMMGQVEMIDLFPFWGEGVGTKKKNGKQSC